MSPASNKDELLAELKGHHLPATLLDAVSYKLRQLEYAEQKVQLLEERLRLQRLNKYGPGSEKLSNLQLELLEQEPGVSQAEVEAEGERDKPAPRTGSQAKRPHPGRQNLPGSLPRVERVIPCTAEQCVCSHCQRQTTPIGYDESEHLELEPAKYFVVVTRREKRACHHCGGGGSDRRSAGAQDRREGAGKRPDRDRYADPEVQRLCWLPGYVTLSHGMCVNRGIFGTERHISAGLDLGKEGHEVRVVAPVLC